MIDNLIKLGFKEQEAEIYQLLISQPGITAYKISKVLRKTKAGIYKTLEYMLEKGMVVSTQINKAVEYVPTDLSIYLDSREKEFASNRKIAEEKVKTMRSDTEPQGIYNLEHLDQTYERIIQMINSTESSLILMCVKIFREEVVEALRKAVERGVKVMIDAFSPAPDVPGADIQVAGNAEELLEQANYSWMELFCDGKECTLTLIDINDTKLLKGVWCNDAYLSVIFYNANIGEYLFAKAMTDICNEKDPKLVFDEMQRLRQNYYIGINMEKISQLMNGRN